MNYIHFTKEQYFKYKKKVSVNKRTGNTQILQRQLTCLNRYEHRLKLAGVIGLACLGTLASSPIYSQCTAPMDQFMVNTSTSMAQTRASAAMDLHGNFIVVWQSNHLGGSNIYGQRYASDGSLNGGEFVINDIQATTISHIVPGVAMDAIGNFVVAWERSIPSMNENVILAKKYDANANVIVNEFEISQTNMEILRNHQPSVAIDADGDFVISWHVLTSTSNNEIYFRRFNAMGSPEDDMMQASIPASQENNLSSSVAMDEFGNFVIAWQNSSGATSTSVIQFRRYDNNGDAIVGIEQANTSAPTFSRSNNPSVDMNYEGDFVIVWDFNDGGTSYNIFSRRYNSMGVAMDTPEVKVNDVISDVINRNPDVDMDNMGNYVVAWHENILPLNIYGRRFNSQTMGFDSEFVVNSSTESHSRLNAATAMDECGKFLVAWQSNENTANDIFARLYICPMIKDISISDPCNCDDPNNVIENRMILRFHDVLTISGTGIPGQNVVLTDNANPQGFTDANGIPYPMGHILGTVDMNGNFTLNFPFYRAPGEEVDISVNEEPFSAEACIDDCEPAPIPTISQWGIVIMGLFISIFALIGIRKSKWTPG